MTHGRRGGSPREAVTGASRQEQLGGLRHLHRVSPRPRASGLANCYLHPGIVTSRSSSSCVCSRRARGWFAGRGESVFIPRSVLPAHIHSPADHPALCNVSASGILPQAESQGSLEPKALSVFCKNLNPFYKTLNPGGEWEGGREAKVLEPGGGTGGLAPPCPQGGRAQGLGLFPGPGSLGAAARVGPCRTARRVPGWALMLAGHLGSLIFRGSQEGWDFLQAPRVGPKVSLSRLKKETERLGFWTTWRCEFALRGPFSAPNAP